MRSAIQIARQILFMFLFNAWHFFCSFIPCTLETNITKCKTFEIACLSFGEQSIEMMAWHCSHKSKSKPKLSKHFATSCCLACQRNYITEFTERNQDIRSVPLRSFPFQLFKLHVFVNSCAKSIVQLFNFDFQDVLQYSLKSTMDFWYKFTQPQTFSFRASFILSMSFSWFLQLKLNRGT